MTDGERETWSGLAGKIAGHVPASFLGLLVVNMAFLGLMFWFLDAREDSRAHLVGKLVDACVEQIRDRHP